MDASAANTIKGRAPLRASGALRSALKKRGKSPGTLSYFYSAKNDKDLVLASDLDLCSALDLEADEHVRSYETDKVRIAERSEREWKSGAAPDVFVTCHDGSVRLRYVRYGRTQCSKCPPQDQVLVGLPEEFFAEKEVRDRERLIHDWLHIAPVLHETRWQLAASWTSVSREVFKQVGSGPCTLGSLTSAMGRRVAGISPSKRAS